jgi:hypothetical protein
MGGGYSPFTHRTLVSHPSLAVVRRAQRGRQLLSRIPRSSFVAPASNPCEASVPAVRVLNRFGLGLGRSLETAPGTRPSAGSRGSVSAGRRVVSLAPFAERKGTISGSPVPDRRIVPRQTVRANDNSSLPFRLVGRVRILRRRARLFGYVRVLRFNELLFRQEPDDLVLLSFLLEPGHAMPHTQIDDAARSDDERVRIVLLYRTIDWPQPVLP